MKTEELTALGLTEEQAKSVLAMNGRDIERHKNDAEALRTQLGTAQKQLGDANSKLEGYCILTCILKILRVSKREKRLSPIPNYKSKTRINAMFMRVSGGALEGIRTPDLLVRSQTLYPTELQAHILFSKEEVLFISLDYNTTSTVRCQEKISRIRYIFPKIGITDHRRRPESYFSMRHTAWAAMPSPVPVKPSPSSVVALTLTASISTPHAEAIFPRMVSIYGRSFGR